MEDFLGQLDEAVTRGLHFIALAGALAVPDMCAALGSPAGDSDPSRYKAWFDANVAPRYAGNFSGGDCWQFRNALLHQGRIRHRRSRYSRILFIEPGSSTWGHNSVDRGVLYLDVGVFVASMTRAARAWLPNVQGTEPYETNYARFIRRHPHGLAPYVRGVPLIG